MRNPRGAGHDGRVAHLHLLRDVPPETPAEVVVTVQLPGGGQLVLPSEMTVAEVQARFSADGIVHRGRPWSAAEAAAVLGTSPDSVKRRLRRDASLRAACGAFTGGPRNQWLIPEDGIPVLLDRWLSAGDRVSHGVESGDRPEATEPRYPSPPASEASERGIADLNDWKEAYDGR